MSATLPHVPGEHGEPPVPPAKTSLGRGPGYYARRGLKALASLQLTVGLFAVGIGLVFFGTLAQIDFGIWTVVDKYFWSWTVDVPFDLFRKFLNVFWKEWYPPGGSAWTGSFPFPAGKLVGALMLTNLLAAHAMRFKLSWKRAGIFLIHGGMLLLFAGEFVTREFAVEQQMRITEGESADFTFDTKHIELAFTDPSDPAFDRQVVIEQWRLKAAKPGERIVHPNLPVDVEVLRFMKNSDLVSVTKFEPPAGSSGGVFVPSEKGTGPAAYIRLFDKAAKKQLGVFAVSPLLAEQWVVASDRAYRIALGADGLTVVDTSPAAFDRVAKVSLGRLERDRERLTHPDLGVDIDVLQFMPKAELVTIAAVGEKPFAGVALVETSEESGVATKTRGDIVSAYVRLYKKGTNESLGVRAVSVFISLQDQPLTADGKEYRLTLRAARYQKPYRVQLDKFSFDRYEGTDKPKNFSSDVRVFDAAGNLVRQQRVRMNEPMRFAGETFYQSGWDEVTEKGTVLSVVKNPGMVNFGLFYASVDYLACTVVTTGLLLHFGIFLVRFLNRARQPKPSAVGATLASPRELLVSRRLPWIVLALMTLYVLSVFGRMNPPREPYDLDALSRVPVLDGGRVKPLDTVARVNLRIVSGTEEFKDEAGKKQPAIRWYLELLASGGGARGSLWSYPFIRIDNEQVLHELGLTPVEGLRYSLEQVGPKFDKIRTAYEAAQKKVDDGGKLETTEMKYKELHDRLTTAMDLASFGGPDLLPPDAEQGWTSAREFKMEARTRATAAAIIAAQERLRASGKLASLTADDARALIRATGLDPDKLKLDADKLNKVAAEAVQQIAADPLEVEKEIREAVKKRAMKNRRAANQKALQMIDETLQNRFDLAAALLTPAERQEVDAVRRAAQTAEEAKRPAFANWEKVVSAYREKNAPEFNAAVARLGGGDASVARVRAETTFNRFQPFYQCTGLYVIGFVLSVIGFVLSAAEKPHWAEALRRSGVMVLLLALVVHTLALLARMYLMDRAFVFVTNLYSSAVFIGWGCVLLCLVLERLFPIGVGSAVAAALGLSTCIVAHNLGTDDTLEMMQAVLDTNFWLATHVTTVTLGYTATFVAGFLGAVYVLTLLGAVVRDSYASTGEPTVGALLAFGAAVLGLVAVPAFFLWFMKSALDKFEVVPSVLADGVFVLAGAGAVVYGLVLMILRVSSGGVDAHGKPLQGQVPPLARPVVALALTPESGKILGQMIYGVVAFATLLSFVGTVLGGIWADQSWGRFWGWDPKENGAVLIVLWNALILHARWCGLVKDRGTAVLAVFGNAMTAWSWFGTNQLGVGLHAYGFDTRLADGCFNFWALQLVIVAFGASIPRHFWAGAARRAPVAAASALPVAKIVTPPAATPVAPPATATAAMPTSTPPANGHADGNGHSRRDKGKRQGKRK